MKDHSQLIIKTSLASLMLWSAAAFADIAADMEKVQKALDEQDLTAAAKLLRPIAEQNYLPAQVAFGELLHSSQENEEAFGWFMMAAYQGDAAAAYNLGQMYSIGEGVEQNTPKAQYWTKVAADKNNIPAIQALISSYRDGSMGFTADPDQVQKWEAKLTPLMEVARRATQKGVEKALENRDKEFEALIKADKERKAAAKKAENEAAAKKVDDADPALSPSKTKK